MLLASADFPARGIIRLFGERRSVEATAMQSPFPGMDPYLERHWGDVHQALITYIRDQLQAILPDDLRARMQERVYIESPDWRHEYYPDVRVIEQPRRPSAGGGTAVAEPASISRADDGAPTPALPIVIHLDAEPVTEGYIEIIDVKSGHRVITSIEVLSPANKHAGEGQRLFLQKRDDMKRAGVNIVEIDLLRGGDRVLMVPVEQIPPSHRTDYQVCVWCASQPGSVLVYKASLRERLPIMMIPLRPTDPEALLDIQAVLDLCYRNGGYHDIDYTVEPEPRLKKADVAWADALLREQGRR
jgi:Protein of unknown function (DUF4058)